MSMHSTTTLKNFLYYILFLCFTIPLNAQERITDLNAENSKIRTFLTTHEQKNYIVTIAPDDLVRFYEVRANNNIELIREKEITYAYSSSQRGLYVLKNHFILFTSPSIYNYDFIQDRFVIFDFETVSASLSTSFISNPGKDYLYFKLNNNQYYCYFFKENRLQKINVDVDAIFENYIVSSRRDSTDIIKYYFSDNYGIDNTFIFQGSTTPSVSTQMYHDFLLGLDDENQILRYHYTSGKMDTLLRLENDPKTNYLSLGETENYILVVSRKTREQSQVDLYHKSDLSVIGKSIYLNSSSEVIFDNHIIETDGYVIFATTFNTLYFYNKSTQTTSFIKNHFMDSYETFFITENQMILYGYQPQHDAYILSLLDLETFTMRQLYNTEKTKISDHFSGTQWFKSGDYYIYNKSHLKDISFLITFRVPDFEVVRHDIDTLYQGVAKNHPLVTIKDKVFLCTDDLYEITESGYHKINNNPLTFTDFILRQSYIIQEDYIVYVEALENSKVIFIIDEKGKTRIHEFSQVVGFRDIKRIGDYVFYIDAHMTLFMVNPKTGTIQEIDSSVYENVFGANQIFADGKYLFYQKNQNIYLYDPQTGQKKHLIQSPILIQNPLVVVNGVTTFIFHDKICILDDQQNLKTVLNTTIVGTPDAYIVDKKLLYFTGRIDAGWSLFKFDGKNISQFFDEQNLQIAALTHHAVMTHNYENGKLKDIFIMHHDYETIYQPKIPEGSKLTQIADFKNKTLGIFSASDSLYIVAYNTDYSDYDIIYTEYEPISLNKRIVGSLPADRLLITTGRRFLYMDEDEKILPFKSIFPNNEYNVLHTTDSIFYFMAIGRPYGNQVYAFNHDSYTRILNSATDIDISSDLAVYPNPTSQILSIQLPNTVSSDEVLPYQIVDIHGRTMMVGSTSNHQEIGIQHLPSGSYFINIGYNQKQITTKFIKQ